MRTNELSGSLLWLNSMFCPSSSAVVYLCLFCPIWLHSWTINDISLLVHCDLLIQSMPCSWMYGCSTPCLVRSCRKIRGLKYAPDPYPTRPIRCRETRGLFTSLTVAFPPCSTGTSLTCEVTSPKSGEAPSSGRTGCIVDFCSAKRLVIAWKLRGPVWFKLWRRDQGKRTGLDLCGMTKPRMFLFWRGFVRVGGNCIS